MIVNWIPLGLYWCLDMLGLVNGQDGKICELHGVWGTDRELCSLNCIKYGRISNSLTLKQQLYKLLKIDRLLYTGLHQIYLADTLPWMCPNTTGAAAGAPKPAFPNEAYWHGTGADLKASTPARIWAEVVCSKDKPTKKIKQESTNAHSTTRNLIARQVWPIDSERKLW